MTDTNDTPQPVEPWRKGSAPPFDSERAKAAAYKAAARRQADREELAALRRERVQLEKALARQADRCAGLEAQAVELRADARAARAGEAAARRELERLAAAQADKARRTPVPNAPPIDLGATLDAAAVGSVRTLAAVLRSLATASRTGDLVRSGADAAALLDGVTRAAVAVQALADRVAAAPVRRGRAAAPIEAGAVDIAALAESIRARASLPAADDTVTRGNALHVSATPPAPVDLVALELPDVD